jgi:hypothetical protein
VLVGFRSAWVWDISSTEGRDLPELSCEVTGDVGVYRERLIDFVIAQGVTLEFKESIAPALGMCYGDRIVLLPGQSPAEEFSTLVHELAHSFLHRAERRSRQAAKLVDKWKSRLVELDRAGVAARQAKLWADEHT